MKNLSVRIDWLMLLFPIVAAALGEGRSMALLLGSLTIHECAHILAAKALRVSIRSLRMTPFGAMAQIENPYSMPTGRLLAVSAAGPCANLFALLTAASLCHWRWLDPFLGAELIGLNATLMLFNLLPALPLDGGRMLYALLCAKLPRRKAAEIGILAGKILACILLAIPIAGAVRYGKLNLSPIFAALFLLTAAQDERRALTDSRLRSLLGDLRPLEEPRRAEIVAIGPQTTPEAALNAAAPDRVTLYAVFSQDHLTQLIDERTLLDRIAANPVEENAEKFK